MTCIHNIGTLSRGWLLQTQHNCTRYSLLKCLYKHGFSSYTVDMKFQRLGSTGKAHRGVPLLSAGAEKEAACKADVGSEAPLNPVAGGSWIPSPASMTPRAALGRPPALPTQELLDLGLQAMSLVSLRRNIDSVSASGRVCSVICRSRGCECKNSTAPASTCASH